MVRLQGNDVRLLRHVLGIRQGAMAKAMGINQQYLYKLENGNRNLTPRMQLRFIKGLVTVEQSKRGQKE